jgi:hypothetical protein
MHWAAHGNTAANQLSKMEEDFIRQIDQTAKQIEKAK